MNHCVNKSSKSAATAVYSAEGANVSINSRCIQHDVFSVEGANAGHQLLHGG